MRRDCHRPRSACSLVACAAAALILGFAGNASATTLQTLHSFCTTGGATCTDGAYPLAGLIKDATGAVYGVVSEGGTGEDGVLFRLTAANGKVTFARLHTFCKSANCRDGGNPKGVLIMDTNGNLYGTTESGGNSNEGVVFELSHSGNSWKYTRLYNFCPHQGCTDGSNPKAGLAYVGQSSGALWDGTSPLFGTTNAGGTHNNGTVFELTKNGSQWTESVLHSFDSSSQPNSLLIDSAGNIFGTSLVGGTYGGGLMFKLASGTWKETVLHNFCNQANCTDGFRPEGLLVEDSAGNLFGTTLEGGTGSHQTCNNDGGCGVVFERTAGGTYGVLYNFCSLSQCADGHDPEELLLESNGNLLGGTASGGSGQSGVLFELVNNGGSWSQSVLYNFCSIAGCADGIEAIGGLLLDGSGDIWGTTYDGGKNNAHGTVFRLQP